MKYLLRQASRSTVLFALAACLVCAQDWKTAASLPGIDLTGLSPAQKGTVLKILREQDCTCNCGMKMAECRVKDPSCSYSHGMAESIIAAVKEGKSEADALKAASASRWAKVQQPSILDAPVAIPTAGAPVAGPQDAPITLVEFSDFQCPYCAAAVPQINAVLKNYPKQVKLIFKEYPLETHSQAALAAAAAVAAQKQGKFWQMHDAMFANRDNLSRQTIMTLAQQAGLDMKRFASDLNSTEVHETVIRDVQDGDAAGVQGTPTLFINGQRYNGPIELNTIKPLLDAQLQKNAPAAQTASASTK
jgi:protein-disulfide isomerase